MLTIRRWARLASAGAGGGREGGARGGRTATSTFFLLVLGPFLTFSLSLSLVSSLTSTKRRFRSYNAESLDDESSGARDLHHATQHAVLIR